MRNGRAALTAYGILLICLFFTLGYLLGLGKGETQVQVVVEAPETETVQTENRTEPPQTQPEEPTAEKPLDLNTAEKHQLEQLPGIGPGLADRIIAYREEHGTFLAKEQIMDVEGIGEKRYAELEALITIGGTQ